jgi:hypothetical protein
MSKHSQLIDIISLLKVKDLTKLANDFGFKTRGLLKQDLVDILQTIPSLYTRVPVDEFDLTKKATSELSPLTNTPRSSVTSLNTQISRPVLSTKKALLKNIIPLLKLDDLKMIADDFFIKTRGLLKQDLTDILLELPYEFLHTEYDLSQFDLTKNMKQKLLTPNSPVQQRSIEDQLKNFSF